MHSGCPHSQGGIYRAQQHQINADALKSPQNSDVPLSVVHPANGIQTNTVATQYPGEFGVAYCPASTISTILERDGMGQDLRSSVPENKKVISNPLLYALLRANSPDYSSPQYFKNTQSTLPGKTTVNIEHDTSSHFPDKRQKCQQVKSLPPALNGEHKLQNLDRLRGTNFTYCHPPFSFPSLSGQMANEPPTDDQIRDFIKNKLARYTNVSTQQSRKYDSITTSEDNRDSTLQSNSVAHLPTSVSEEYGDRQSLLSLIEQSAAGGQTPKDDSSKSIKANVALTFKSSVASEKHSTEYPKIMVKVAATCTKNEDESPVVLTAVSPMTLDELPKHSNSLFNCGSSHEEYKSPLLNVNKTLDEMDKAPGLYCAGKSITEQEKRDIEPKPVESVGLANVQGVTDVSEPSLMLYKNSTSDLSSFLENQVANTKISRDIYNPPPCHITCKEAVAHSKINSSIQILNVVSLTENQELCKINCEDARKVAGLVHSQSDLSVALPENEVREQPSKSQNKYEQASSVNILNNLNPQYEDISDDDTSNLLTKLPNSEQEELRVPACFKDIQYEDISEDENPQIENMAVETASLKQLPESNSQQLTFENEDYGHVWGQAQLKTEVILVEKRIPKKQQKIGMVDTDKLTSNSCLVEIADGAEHRSRPKCDCERPLESQTKCSCSHSSGLKDETEYQMDDDWIVLPISMSDLKFEREEEAQDDTGVIVLQDSETESIESLDDTSPKKQRLHHPVSNPVPASGHPQIEEFDTIESFLRAKTIQFSRRSSLSTPVKEMDIATDSHKAQNRRESYSESEDNCETDDSVNYSPASEHNYLTVTGHLTKTPAPVPSDKGDSVPEKSEHEVTNMEISQTRDSRLQKLKKLMDAKAGSKHVEPKSNKRDLSKKEDIIIIDSDTEDESDQNCKKKAKRRRLSSSSEDRGDLSCSQQRGHSLKTVDNLGETFKEKLQENTPYVDLPAPQHQSEPETIRQNSSTQESVIILDSDTEDESDRNYQKANSGGLFYSGSEDGGKIRKTEELTEAKVDSEHIQMAKRQTASKRAVSRSSDEVGNKDHNRAKKATIERILSSGSNDSGSALLTVQNRHSAETMNSLYEPTTERHKKTTLSSKESPDELLQAVGKEDENKDETPALKTSKATRKKTVSRDLDRNNQDRYVPKSKSGNEKHCKTKNKVLSNGANLRLVSRQPQLSSQEVSTSISSLTSPGGQLSEVRQSSASSKDLPLSAERSAFPSLPKSKPSTADPTHLSSSKLKRSLSCSQTSPTQGPPSSARIQLPAKERAIKDWARSFDPVRKARRSSLGMESSSSPSYLRNRNARPSSSHIDRAPRQRHNSHKSTPPLMKKTKSEAIQRTKEINRDTSREQRSSVGKGFKWLEKPTLSRPKNSRF